MTQNVHAGRNLLKKLHTLSVYLKYIKYSFIHNFNNNLLNAYYVLGTRIDRDNTRIDRDDTEENKTVMIFAFVELTVQ